MLLQHVGFVLLLCAHILVSLVYNVYFYLKLFIPIRLVLVMMPSSVSVFVKPKDSLLSVVFFCSVIWTSVSVMKCSFDATDLGCRFQSQRGAC